MVLFVSCFGVEVLCCLNLMYVSIILIKFGRVAAYWEIAAHPAYDMFSEYKYLIFLGFWSGNFFLIAHFPGHCHLVFFFFFFHLSVHLTICCTLST